MNEWGCIGGINETNSNECEEQAVPACSATLAVHAPDHRSSRKRMWFNEARAPHPPRPIVKTIIYSFCCIELNCNRLFCVFALTNRVAFGTSWFVDHMSTYTYTNSFWRLNVYRLFNRRVAKGKPAGTRKQVGVCGIHTHLLAG